MITRDAFLKNDVVDRSVRILILSLRFLILTLSLGVAILAMISPSFSGELDLTQPFAYHFTQDFTVQARTSVNSNYLKRAKVKEVKVPESELTQETRELVQMYKDSDHMLVSNDLK